MAEVNGTIDWGIQPKDYSGSSLSLMNYSHINNSIISCNNPMRYQVEWSKSGLTEAHEPSKDNWDNSGNTSKGDVINVVFDVYATSEFPKPTSSSEWEKIATIKKSRDIANRHYADDSQPTKHRFTVDISQVCSDLLSYSLAPIGAGTWNYAEFGGMNGGKTMQDNVTSKISNYNVSRNGTYRYIRVKARCEIINSDGSIINSTNSLTSNDVTVVNSVFQYEREDSHMFNRYYIYRWQSNTSDKPKSFLTRQPYLTQDNVKGFKSVREDEEAEWLYWYQGEARYASDETTASVIDKIHLKVYIPNVNTIYLSDFSDTLDKGNNNGLADTFNKTQERVCVQNVSASYINANNGTTYTNAKEEDGTSINVSAHPNGLITSTNREYRVNIQIRMATSTSTNYKMSGMMWYKLDTEAEHPFGYVRFHWLNRLGGIDSYTAKRDVVEGLSVNKDTIERNSADRTWYQSNKTTAGTTIQRDMYRSDTMRGGDTYKGGREVMNVNAERTNSVFTEPLNRSTAEWLEELITSPNVWIEMETESTRYANDRNPALRPSTKGYVPVIITNSDVETVNQEQGLTKFNIEYTLAHKIQTQRN